MNLPDDMSAEARKAVENYEKLRKGYSVDVAFLGIEAEALFALARTISEKVVKEWEGMNLELSEKWEDQAGRYSAQASECVRLTSKKVERLQEFWEATKLSLEKLGYSIEGKGIDFKSEDWWPDVLSDDNSSS